MPNLAAPPASVIADVHRMCPECWPYFLATLRAVRAAQPIELTSWWRSLSENQRVGGSQLSQHLFATALDLVGPGAADVARQLRDLGWVWVSEGDHEHVQMFSRNPFIPLSGLVV